MTGVVGLHHVQVAAPPGCEPAARAFYGGLLGLPEIEKPPLLAVRGGCWFSLGDGELHVGVEDPFTTGGEGTSGTAASARAPSAGGARAALAATGIEITWADDAEIPGQRRFHVSDPWGNRLELVAE